MGIFHSKNNRVNKVQYIKEKSPSKIESEDALLINDALGIYGVMDGATPIDSFKDENGHNSAYLAANLIKGYLESLEEISYLPDEVLKANSLLKHEMKANGINLTDKSQLWSSCVSAIQIKNNSLIYTSMGDTMILTCDNSNHINVLTVDSVKNISARAKLTRTINRYKGIDVPDEKHFLNQKNKIAYHRQMANTPNGYSVANGMEEAKDHMQYGMVDLDNLKHVLITSDGLFDPQNNIQDVYRKIEKDGLEEYVQKLSIYESDHGIKADDKTTLLLSF